MARADRRRAQRARPAAVTRRADVVVEDTMFFPRLRRHAKWVFLFLAIAFALGFVGFGVGAGGVGFGDVFRGSGSSSGIPSVSDAQKRVDENPKDAQAFRDLATALPGRRHRRTRRSTRSRATSGLRPKDADALRELAGLYLVQVSDAQQKYQIGRAPNPRTSLRRPRCSSSSTWGAARSTWTRSRTAVSSVVSQDSNAALSDAQQAASNAVATYKKIAALSPNDPTVQLELGEAARNAGDAATAIAAYEKYLRLVPTNDPTAREVRRLLTLAPSRRARLDSPPVRYSGRHSNPYRWLLVVGSCAAAAAVFALAGCGTGGYSTSGNQTAGKALFVKACGGLPHARGRRDDRHGRAESR